MTSGLELPTISLVTPSLNRASHLGETMDSVLGQRYPHLEYVVVDGGSTDGSADLVRARASELTWWVSEPDHGAWEAINKGFARTSGEVMGWLGSDDLLMPWTLSIVGEVFATFPEIEWLTTLFPTVCDEQGRPVQAYYLDAYSEEAFFRGENLPFADWPAAGFIEQEATFWRRSLWERAGGRLDESLRLAADFELWARFHRCRALLHGIPIPLAAFRVHGDQMSQLERAAYVDEARAVLRRYGGAPPRVSGMRLLRRFLVRVVPLPVRRRVGGALEELLGIPPARPSRSRALVHDGPARGWRIEIR